MSGSRRIRVSSIWLVIAAAAGCASPTPPQTLLALPSLAGSSSSTAGSALPAADAPKLAVRRIGLPEYLLARRVRYRDEASTLAAWPNTFWAERFEVGVTRELTNALRRELPGWTLCDGSCATGSPDLSLQLDLAPLDFVRGTRQLQAHAGVTLASTGGAARTLSTLALPLQIDAAADTPQAHAQALSELLQALAQRIAAAVQALPR